MNILYKFIKLFIGFFVCGASIIMNVNSSIGTAPWDVLGTGVVNVTGMTIGTATVIISIIVVIVDYMLGVKIGVGTILNMIFIGVCADIVNYLNFIPKPTNIVGQWILLFLGMITLNIGVYLYISVGWGAGPRDGFMLGLSKKLNKPASVVKTVIEVVVTAVGIFLGGAFGLGTIFIAVTGGTVMGIMYRFMKFDIKAVKHYYIDDYVRERLGSGVSR